MSRIYFHSEHGEAEVRGSERAYMGIFCSDLFNVALGLDHETEYGDKQSRFRQIVKPYHYSLSGGRFIESIKTALAVSWEPLFILDGEPVNTFVAQLNTALVVGNDIVKLMARLHGQCEIHCWVEGPNRAWLAGLIESGCEAGLFRESADFKSGWDSVITLLRSRDNCPVVTSFSVCESFPNPHVANWKPATDDPDNDAWYELTDAERWGLGMEGLRADPLREMKPDNWASYYFRDGMDAFKIKAALDCLPATTTA